MFQSTPPRGGRPAKRRGIKPEDLFQSTPPRGGRRAKVQRELQIFGVSIHAPTRGATKTLRAKKNYRQSFNPRPHAGGDDYQIRGWQENITFQSTPPRGGRRPTGSFVTFDANMLFQSTPPRGGRQTVLYCSASSIFVSIHAPTRGATA